MKGCENRKMTFNSTQVLIEKGLPFEFKDDEIYCSCQLVHFTLFTRLEAT